MTIRNIQHYLYCPRRFGLLELNTDWKENAFVVQGNLAHERVHSGEHTFSDKKGFCQSDVELYNDELDINGKADCIEFEKSDKAEYSEKLGGRYIVRVIEYKPTLSKSKTAQEADIIQTFAQKVCADSIFGVNCEGVLYYTDVRRRVKLPFDTEYDKYYIQLTSLLEKMRAIIDSGIIPQRVQGQKCSGCSLEDICMPKRASYSVHSEIIKLAKEE